MALSMFERELLAPERQAALRREARAAGAIGGRPLRERVAATLMALALRPAPAAREGIPAERVATGVAR